MSAIQLLYKIIQMSRPVDDVVAHWYRSPRCHCPQDECFWCAGFVRLPVDDADDHARAETNAVAIVLGDCGARQGHGKGELATWV